MTIYEAVGKRIMEYRKRRQVSREQLAELVGLSAYYIGQIERGDRKMSFDTLVNISDCLHVSIDVLIRGEGTVQSRSELQELLDNFSDEELALITDIVRVAAPHLRMLKRGKK